MSNTKVAHEERENPGALAERLRLLSEQLQKASSELAIMVEELRDYGKDG